MRFAILVVLCLTVLASCAQGDAAFEFFVILKPHETERFIGVMRSMATDDGLKIYEGRSPPNSTILVRYIEGDGHGVRLWVENAIGDVNPEHCGIPYANPQWFVAFTEPRFFEWNRKAAGELGKSVFARLRKLGFDVRTRPVCGTSAAPSDS